MKILFATAEAWPFVKTGGLADVAHSLTKTIKEENIDIRVIMPKYSAINVKFLQKAKFIGSREIWVAFHNEYVGIEEVEYSGVTYYLVDNERYFKRNNIYGEFDDCERFVFFAKAVVETMEITNFIPDIIHCNDWQTGLIPIYLKERNMFLKTIFTIHNLRFQGFFFNNVIESLLEIDRNKYFQEDGIKYYDMISFLKAGVVYSDYITTVSPTYAKEIKTPELGEGIDGIFRKYDYKLRGIINGIDNSLYSMGKKTKKDLKKDLQTKLGLKKDPEIPIVAIVTRLDRQKGIDLIIDKFDAMLHLGIQFVLLGTGENRYEEFFRWKEKQYPGRVCSYIGFNEKISVSIYAGSDIFLMPSLYEPCGLSQMIAMLFGTIPLVRETGGLKDTIIPYNEYTEKGNGFGFNNINSDEMYNTLKYALSFYAQPKKWANIMKNAKNSNNTWKKSADEYIELYKEMLGLPH